MDFNARNENDPGYVNAADVSSMLDVFMQELDILFSVEKGTVMGQRKFGLSVEHLLWKTTFNHEYMQSTISTSITDNCFASQFFRWKVDVELYKGQVSDIGSITIHIMDEKNTVIAAPNFVFK